MDIYLLIDGQQQGPYAEEQVRQSLEKGLIPVDLPAWREGVDSWVEVQALVMFSNGHDSSLQGPHLAMESVSTTVKTKPATVAGRVRLPVRVAVVGLAVAVLGVMGIAFLCRNARSAVSKPIEAVSQSQYQTGPTAIPIKADSTVDGFTAVPKQYPLSTGMSPDAIYSVLKDKMVLIDVNANGTRTWSYLHLSLKNDDLMGQYWNTIWDDSKEGDPFVLPFKRFGDAGFRMEDVNHDDGRGGTSTERYLDFVNVDGRTCRTEIHDEALRWSYFPHTDSPSITLMIFCDAQIWDPLPQDLVGRNATIKDASAVEPPPLVSADAWSDAGMAMQAAGEAQWGYFQPRKGDAGEVVAVGLEVGRWKGDPARFVYIIKVNTKVSVYFIPVVGRGLQLEQAK